MRNIRGNQPWELLEEVVICDNVVKLYFKIPLPNPELSTSQKKTPDKTPGVK